MQLHCEQPFLECPVSYTARSKRLEFLDGDTLVYDLDIPLDPLHPDYVVYLPIRHLLGRTLTLRTVPEMPLTLRQTAEDEAPRASRLRPKFHYTAKQGWLNDPNGLCTVDGTYHLFYQYNPASSNWGNMHWGHAVSTDLLRWEEREPALYPDELGTMFSGSAVVDFDNRSGLGDGIRPPLLLYYTAAGGASALSAGKKASQCLAYSTDGGLTFRKYEGNPIIPYFAEENRDPKVIYHPETDRYILALFLNKHDYGLFASDNLLDWSLLQVIAIDEDWECPDFYPLPLDGDGTNIKWVLIGAYDRYLVGSFDGYSFRAEQSVGRLHVGNASYAAQSWFNLREGDSRRVRIAWNNHALPAAPFNMSMNIPCEMTLRTVGDRMVLCANPIAELRDLYQEIHQTDSRPLPCRETLREAGYDLQIELSGGAAGTADIRVFGLHWHLDWSSDTISWDDFTAPLCLENGRASLRILLDTTGAEVFIGGGQCLLTCGQMLDYNLCDLELSGTAVLEYLQIAELKAV